MSVPTKEDIRSLSSAAEFPCISIFFPTIKAGPQTQQNHIRMKNLLRQAETQLEAQGVDEAQRDKLLQPGWAMVEDQDFWQHQSDGLAVFLGPQVQKRYRVPRSLEELVVVGERWHITPLLPLLSGDGHFYILALSQNRVRLMEANRESAREIDLRDIPESLADALGYDLTQRTLQFHTGAPTNRGGNGGSRRAMFHGHGAGNEDNKEEISRFCHRVDDGVRKLLKDTRTPMVLAAVDYLIPIYREASKYPNLIAGGVEGNPDDSSAEELQAKAWKLVEPYFLEEQEQAAQRFSERASTGQGSHNLQEVVLAAVDGRVETLFVAVDEHRWGHLDVQDRAVRLDEAANGENEDLIDRAALECLLHGGSVYATARQRVPDGASVAALYRF
ncbi:MAG: hypothetical protein SX243_15430 [Acidobacteriota bacterium]|nr:hypothetical protein [Acidobacteriota bacterium]